MYANPPIAQNRMLEQQFEQLRSQSQHMRERLIAVTNFSQLLNTARLNTKRLVKVKGH